MTNIDTLLQTTNVLDRMALLLCSEAFNPLYAETTNADVKRHQTGYRTHDGLHEVVVMGIKATHKELDRALAYMAAELNALARKGLWKSTLSQPATIDLAPWSLMDPEMILTCQILVPTDEMAKVDAMIKTHYVEGGNKLFTLD